MKRIAAASLLLAVMISTVCKTSGKNGILDQDSDRSRKGIYTDGAYQGVTPKDYKGYHASSTILVTGNLITNVDWCIFDNNRNRYFDASYEEVYADYPPFIQQCRDNMKGMVVYGPRLIETQSIDSVECITGAMWCYNKFRQVVKIALKDALLDTSITR